jgi:hypothetical protein
VGTLTRRELLRRIARAAVAGLLILGTREEQAGLLRWLAQLVGRNTALGRWLTEAWWRW